MTGEISRKALNLRHKLASGIPIPETCLAELVRLFRGMRQSQEKAREQARLSHDLPGSIESGDT